MMIGMMSWVHGKITIRQYAYFLIVSFFSNLWAFVATGYFTAYLTGLFTSEPYNSMLISIAVAKVSLPWGVVVLKGVGANSLVTLSVILGATSRSSVGRIIGMWTPVTCFVTIGYEHVIANMGYIPTAVFYGAPIRYGKSLSVVMKAECVFHPTSATCYYKSNVLCCLTNMLSLL